MSEKDFYPSGFDPNCLDNEEIILPEKMDEDDDSSDEIPFKDSTDEELLNIHI